MDNNSLLVIILAFILGCMCSGMMKQMCGGRLVEGAVACDELSRKSVAPVFCDSGSSDSDYVCTMCSQGNYGSPLTLYTSIEENNRNIGNIDFDMYYYDYDVDDSRVML